MDPVDDEAINWLLGLLDKMEYHGDEGAVRRQLGLASRARTILQALGI